MNLDIILSIPKSIITCIKIGGMPWYSLPLLISWKSKVKGIRKGSIELNKPERFGVMLGFGGTEDVYGNNKGYINILPTGKLVFQGKAIIAQGYSIRINSGEFNIGDGCWINKNFHASCSRGITLGDDFLGGWNIDINDSDGHIIIDNGVEKPNEKEINIGNHVWCASNVSIYKGTKIPNNSVVGAHSIVLGEYNKENVLIAGYPATIKKEGLYWKH